MWKRRRRVLKGLNVLKWSFNSLKLDWLTNWHFVPKLLGSHELVMNLTILIRERCQKKFLIVLNLRKTTKGVVCWLALTICTLFNLKIIYWVALSNKIKQDGNLINTNGKWKIVSGGLLKASKKTGVSQVQKILCRSVLI